MVESIKCMVYSTKANCGTVNPLSSCLSQISRPPPPPPPLFRGRKLISPLSFKSHSPPLPSPNYSSLINYRLYQSITTVKLRVDLSRMLYSSVGNSDFFFLILGCMTFNFLYMSFCILHSRS